MLIYRSVGASGIAAIMAAHRQSCGTRRETQTIQTPGSPLGQPSDTRGRCPVVIPGSEPSMPGSQGIDNGTPNRSVRPPRP